MTAVTILLLLLEAGLCGDIAHTEGYTPQGYWFATLSLFTFVMALAVFYDGGLVQIP